MASVFPGAVDAIANTVNNASAEYDLHPGLHNQLADAVMTVETELRPGGSLSLDDHVNALDSHPEYLTQAEADAAYQTRAEADARYLAQTGGTVSGELAVTGNLSAVTLSATSQVAPGNGASVGAALWSGAGVPAAALGQDGDFYFRRDSVTTPFERIYIRSAGTWVGLV